MPNTHNPKNKFTTQCTNDKFVRLWRGVLPADILITKLPPASWKQLSPTTPPTPASTEERDAHLSLFYSCLPELYLNYNSNDILWILSTNLALKMTSYEFITITETHLTISYYSQIFNFTTIQILLIKLIGSNEWKKMRRKEEKNYQREKF